MSLRRAVTIGLGLAVIVAAVVGFVPHRVDPPTLTVNSVQVHIPSIPCGSAFVPNPLTPAANADVEPPPPISAVTFNNFVAQVRGECAHAVGVPRAISFSLLVLAVMLSVWLVQLVRRPSPSSGVVAEGRPLVHNEVGSIPGRSARAQIAVEPSTGPPSLADELRKLAELRDRGSLTAIEFAAAKAHLLAGR